MKAIKKYEHEKLEIDEYPQFKRKQLNKLIQLNNENEGNYFTILPKGVRFNQFVGVIKIDNCTIEIFPKADKTDNSTKWQGVLADMLKYCKKIKVQTSAEASLKRSNLNLLELYFDDFLNETQTLIRNGLIKKYSKESSNVKALKGKLDFTNNIRQNLVHKERFYTSHQVYDTNHKLHQILNVALGIVKQFTSNMSISDKCGRVLLDFPEVDNINVTKQLLDGIELNRKSTPYERAISLARLIILNYSPNISSGKEKMIAILFDMNKLWEEYMLRMLKQATTSKPEVNVLGKKALPFWGTNRLEPDIVITSGEGDNIKTFIVDTKWKTPGKKTSIQDLRQVYAYARFWKSEKVMLLYPGKESIDENAFLDEFDPKVTCYKQFVSVLSEVDNKYKLNPNVGQQVLNSFNL